MTIPNSAVQLGPNGPFTYVVKPDSSVEVRPLRVSEGGGGLTIVREGLAPGERVVTSNQYRLQGGVHVRTARLSRRPPRAAARRRSDLTAGERIVNISEPFVRRPIATSLLMGGIFLVGLVVYPLLPVAPLPQVDFPTIQVSAQLPGASPETMAATVATPWSTSSPRSPGSPR